jgi:hypothetical protein
MKRLCRREADAKALGKSNAKIIGNNLVQGYKPRILAGLFNLRASLDLPISPGFI